MPETSGYSKKSLPEKLGIKSGYKMALLNAPENYQTDILIPLPEQVHVVESLVPGLDLIQFFTRDVNELRETFPVLKECLNQKGSLWISWPKKSAKIVSTITEALVRQIGLDGGLVDIKVCAVDSVWSGLKFVHRVKDRH